MLFWLTLPVSLMMLSVFIPDIPDILSKLILNSKCNLIVEYQTVYMTVLRQVSSNVINIKRIN